MNSMNTAKSSANSLLSAVRKLIDCAKFDKTFRARVTEIISDKTCKIQYKNVDYTVKCDISLLVGDTKLLEGDSVWVKAPCNNWDALYIESGNQSDNGELVNQITKLNGEITELKTLLNQTNRNN